VIDVKPASPTFSPIVHTVTMPDSGGGKDGTNGPPGIFIMDCETFDVLGRWEIDRGPQNLHYDFWWNLPRDYMVTSEWSLPPQFENGIVPED
jgi:methanethiol oxidase